MTNEPVTGARLKLRKAIVTGAASGIGLAVAQPACGGGSARSYWWTCDTRLWLVPAGNSAVQPTRWHATWAANRTSKEWCVKPITWLGGLDIVVTSAGIVRTGSTLELPLSTWDTVIRVNLTGTFLVLKHCLGPMRESGGGAIVTIGSVSSVVAAGRTCAYDASKAWRPRADAVDRCRECRAWHPGQLRPARHRSHAAGGEQR